MSNTTPSRPQGRRRASSVSQALQAIPLNNTFSTEQTSERGGANASSAPSDGSSVMSPSVSSRLSSRDAGQSSSANPQLDPSGVRLRKPVAAAPSSRSTPRFTGINRQALNQRSDPFEHPRYKSDGFWQDLRTGKWMLIPKSSFPLAVIPILLYLNHEYILTNPKFPLPAVVRQFLPVDTPNIWAPFLSLSGFDGYNESGQAVYKRSLKDFCVIAYSMLFFSCFRQTITVYLLKNLAKAIGIPRGKYERFTEQGYAFIYFGLSGSSGILVMRMLPIWWYNTSAFWTTFPVLRMVGPLKAYYLVQAGYWCQQTVILAAGVEKPRKDFKELIAHHLVTLWLIGWSYWLTLTYIGVAIFVTMDVSDVFLALAKCINYISEDWSLPFFGFFVLLWTYMRHYLNIKILWSVWTEYDLIPEWARSSFRPWKEKELLNWWMKYQVFAPIFLLQLLNLFWYFLILRILVRALLSSTVADVRSDDEDEEPSTTDKPSSAEHKQST